MTRARHPSEREAVEAAASMEVGKGSRWACPFTIPEGYSDTPGNRLVLAQQYLRYARGRLRTDPHWADALINWQEQQPKRLTCLCGHPEECHANVLLVICWKIIERETGAQRPIPAPPKQLSLLTGDDEP